MYLQLPNNIRLADLYLEDDQTIWFLIWILRKSGCDRYVGEIILEAPFQVFKETYNYKNSIVWIEKNKKKHGPERGWRSNAQLHWERHWKNGQKDGLSRGWYQNGQLSLECHWKNGRKHGLDRGWYRNGQLWWKEHWKNGQKDGLGREWYGSGQLYVETHWENGQKI